MNQSELKAMIKAIAFHQGVDPNLCMAIAGRETEYVNSKCRYEENWSYLVTPQKFSGPLGITEATETMLQKTSFTAMQIMGSVARELGFQGYLTDLNFPEIGLFFAIMKLKNITLKYVNEMDVISTYNQGSPRKNAKGIYINNEYVENVVSRLKILRNISGGKIT